MASLGFIWHLGIRSPKYAKFNHWKCKLRKCTSRYEYKVHICLGCFNTSLNVAMFISFILAVECDWLNDDPDDEAPQSSKRRQPHVRPDHFNWFLHIVICMCDYRRAFGLEIRFIDGLQVVTTSNYNVIANFHTSQITTAYAVFYVCCVYTSRSLVMASNSGDPSASELTAPTKYFLHRLPYNSFTSE
jgi:hypothetical protein